MKITNKHGLPDAVFNFIARENYIPGKNDYSVTTLLRPPQMVQLERRHYNELEEDALDRVWSVFGHAVHALLESHASETAEAEQRMYLDVCGRTVGGQVDHYHDGIITDYKVTSAWTIVYGSRVHEWEEQLNLYAHIFRQNGKPVTKLQIVAILRDWDKNKARNDATYPRSPIHVINIPVWTDMQCEEFVDHRVSLHIANESLNDNQLRQCTSEEMWEQQNKYAVMKEGRKTAVRVLDTQADAHNYIVSSCPDNWDKNNHSKDLYTVVKRSGRRTRCEEYCPVSRFCHQFKRYQDEPK